MENNENLIADVCNENADLFSEITPEEEAEEEEGDSEEEERDAEQTDVPSEAMIPTAMLTPPSTGEPLLNGSSQSSTSGNDLQQFTADEQSPVDSHHSDEGNSNQSGNSDSVDSKLIINEGSVDSNDISNKNGSKTVESSIDAHLTVDADDISTQPIVIDSNHTDETLDVRNEQSHPVEHDDDVIEQPAVESIVESASPDADTDENDTDKLNTQQHESPADHAVENVKNVPSSQSLNGVVCPDNDESTATVDFDTENRLANETHTEHRKLKRKLSESVSDPFETSAKHTKFNNNQINSLGLSDNQIVLDDSISNHLVNYDQMADGCDAPANDDDRRDSQTEQSVEVEQPTVLEKSQENADENFESELIIDDDDDDRSNDKGDDRDDLLAVTKEKSIDECDHIYMNGHTSQSHSNTESILAIDAPHEEQYNHQQQPQQLQPQSQQPQHEQLMFKPKTDLDDSIQAHALKSKIKNPFSTPPQSETNSTCDNSDERSLDVQPTENQLEIHSQLDLLAEQPLPAISNLATELTTNLKQTPFNHGIASSATTAPASTVMAMNISGNSDSNSVSFANAFSGNKTVDVSYAPTHFEHSKATTIAPSQTQYDNGKKLNTHIRIRRQVFLCSACGTYYEKWNLFYHIREVHNKFICLFCLGIFPNAERLVNHLESKHVHKPFIYEHKDDLIKSLRNQCFLTCCVCEHIFTENDDVAAHSCETFMKPCSVCGLKFIHKSNCKALLSNKSSKHKQKRTIAASNTGQPLMPNTTPPAMQTPMATGIGNSGNGVSQQTFLRNALLGQANAEPRINQFGDYQSTPITAQMPMFDRRLNNVQPHRIPSQPQPHPHSYPHPRSHLQPQPQSQFPPQSHLQLQPQHHHHQQHHQVNPESILSMNAINGAATQQSLVSKLHMNTPEAPSNFYNTNMLPIHNAEMYHANHVPYMNLPNGQYTQNPPDSRYTAPNPSIGKNLDASTKAAFSSDRPEKNQNKDNNNSNSDSSSDSDDSNNDSDSSSDTDVEKEDKENSSKRVVKPFRLNLNKNNMIERRDSPYVDEQNESAHEDDSIDNETGMANSLNDNHRNHHNMSDITNIQRQLNNIQQNLSALQRVEEPEPSLKVPKLTLKLTRPFQNPVESEQSSTESDSESENDDDEENVSHEQHDSNAPIDVESSEKVVNLEQPSFLQPEAEAVHQYSFNSNASDSLSNAVGNNTNSFDGSLNETGSSDKNTSMESDDKPEGVTETAEYQTQSQPQLSAPAQGELSMNCESDQMQIQPEIQSVAEPTANLEQTNIALDDQTNINDNFYATSLEHNQMTPPDSIVDGQGVTESQSGGITAAADLNSESNELEHIDVDTPQVIEDKRPITEFILDQPLDRIPIKEFMRKCLQFTYPTCLYCNHARSIAVSGVSLAEHLIGEHRFSATVDSITAEELLPETIEQKITVGLDELAETYFNMESYDNKVADPNYQYVKHFECFQCRFHSPIYKDLYLHNRKMHLRSALICLMCRSNFYSYSELVCHMCPGAQTKLIPIDLKFRCVLCNLDDIPSAFRLMVHLRKKHSACDVCLEECTDQNKLSSHVWKHKLHHLCYRCNITYRNKADITRHLFWKHGTESVMCKRCLEKKWPHVYHFCVPPVSFKCDICSSTFSKALTLKVHKRSHDPESITFPCSLDDCDQKFISKKLMIKHVSLHYMPELPPPSEEKNLQRETDENESAIEKEGAGLQANSPSNSPCQNSPERIEQEAPIDAVISVIEHDAREQEEKEKQLKKESTGRNESSNEQGHKNKSKKLKKNRSDFSDLLDLPSVNLSESDSSEDSDAESNTPHDPSAENSRQSLSAASGANEMVTKVKSAPSALDDDDEKAVMLEADIWENFKTYQASVSMQDKSLDSDEEEQLIAENPVLLHVSQSDHDYPMMYKPLVKKAKLPTAECATSTFAPIIEEDERGNIKITLIEATESIADQLDPQSPAPLPTSTVTITDEEIPKTDEENIVDNTNEQPDIEKKDAKKSKADKSDRKGDDSDSSSDSSDSDSSCSCGSNCSCSSSSSSSDSSSSDSGSDSSSSEGRRKKVLTKTARTPERTTPEKKVETDEIEQKPEPVNEEIPDAPTISPKVEADEKCEETVADESETIDVGKPEPVDVDVVDVVTTDKKFTQPDIYTIVLESDLETTESETDEEFYDEHPQKLAIQMLAEKRQQLLLQTLNPVNGMPYMSTSRPATPLLPEEQSKGPKTKTKKRRRTHKNSRSPQKQPSKNVARFNPNGLHHTPNSMPSIEKPLDTVIGSQQAMTTASVTIPESTPFTMQSNPFMRTMIDASPQINSNAAALAASVPSTPVTSKFDNLHHTPATLPAKQHLMRLSTSSASDADSSLKRSKRRRIPNKFYGYTSDDESMSAASGLNASYQNPFKPTPPPNLNKWRESLTWSKEDLPKPTKTNRAGTLKKIMRLSSAGKVQKQQRKMPLKGAMKTTGMKNRTLAKIKEKMRMTTTPTVPKIIIRGIPRPNPPKVMAPDLSDASRVPNAPVHRMSPPPKLNNAQSDDSSDSDSDSNLHINQSMARNKFGSHSGDNGEKVGRAQPPKQQMPFIRPDHTLLPPKRFSLSPSPPPTSASAAINHEHQSSQIERLPSNLLSSAMQQPIFNGVQHKVKTQDNARNDNNLYCYCRRPYDEGSEMIACDGQDCSIEWFHFECVGIVKGTTINPQEKWYCPKCKEQNMAQNRYAMQSSNNVNNTNANRFTSTSLDLA